mgnify:CR=1 FL=1
MNKILLFFALSFNLASFGQTINGIPIKELNADYLQIIGTSRFMSSKLNISIDIGQRTKLFSNNNETARIKDENGQVLIFNSIIDALNFMSANGYDFVSANILTQDDSNVYYYLMKKKTKN